MVTWKRDVTHGLIVLILVAVTIWVVYWIFRSIAGLSLITGISNPVFRVLMTLAVFISAVFAVGYLMRTAVGTLAEAAIDAIDQVPGLRVVCNASKMAVELILIEWANGSQYRCPLIKAVMCYRSRRLYRPVTY